MAGLVSDADLAKKKEIVASFVEAKFPYIGEQVSDVEVAKSILEDTFSHGGYVIDSSKVNKDMGMRRRGLDK